MRGRARDDSSLAPLPIGSRNRGRVFRRLRNARDQPDHVARAVRVGGADRFDAVSRVSLHVGSDGGCGRRCRVRHLHLGREIPADTHLTFVSGQVALAAYWLLFEAFDLVGLMRRENRDNAVKALAALNAVGFLGMATIEWSAFSPSTIHILFTYAALAFAATAALRWKLVPPSVVEPSPKSSSSALNREASKLPRRWRRG